MEIRVGFLGVVVDADPGTVTLVQGGKEGVQTVVMIRLFALKLHHIQVAVVVVRVMGIFFGETEVTVLRVSSSSSTNQ